MGTIVAFKSAAVLTARGDNPPSGNTMGFASKRDPARPARHDSATELVRIDKSGPQFGNDLPSALTPNDRNGVELLLQPYVNKVSVRSAVVFHQTVLGTPESLMSPLQFGPNTSGISLCSRDEIVLRSAGTVSAPDAVTTTWTTDGLQLGVRVRERINGAASDPPPHLAQIAVRSLA